MRRKPLLLLRLSGLLLLRFETRQFLALLFQLPPRKTRFEPPAISFCFFYFFGHRNAIPENNLVINTIPTSTQFSTASGGLVSLPSLVFSKPLLAFAPLMPLGLSAYKLASFLSSN
jgi:hypothetical protein